MKAWFDRVLNRTPWVWSACGYLLVAIFADAHIARGWGSYAWALLGLCGIHWAGQWNAEARLQDSLSTAKRVIADVKGTCDELFGFRDRYLNLPPVSGNLLPELGATVYIHLSSSDSWVAHEVVGFYVWHDCQSRDKYLHRVFVRVRRGHGFLNARLLSDIRTTKPE